MPRRPGFWADTVVSQNVNPATPAVIDLMAQLNLDERRGITADRLIIRLWFSDVAAAAQAGISTLDLGIGVSSNEAFALGITALPNPNTRDDRPALGWMFRTRVLMVETTVNRLVTELKEDIRASRRINSGTLTLVAEQLDIVGAVTVRMAGIVRTHYLLP